MKKLMFTAAVAAAMGAFAIESANIVGYSEVPNDVSGYCQRGALFITCGDQNDSYNIQSIIPQTPANAATDLDDGAAVIQQIDDFGEVIATYSYFIEGSPMTGGGVAGWYSFEAGSYVYADVTFIRGEGFLYQAPYFEDANEEEVGSSFQTAGEVKTGAKSVYSEVSGYCHRANYRHTNLSIQKLTPKATEDAATDLDDGAAVIQEIDDFGEVIATYSYFIEGSPMTGGGAAGWYSFEAGSYVYATKEFTPGEGFLYQAPYFEDANEEEIGSYLQFAD